MAGALEYHRDTGEPTTVGILHGFVPNQGDAWGYTLEALDRYFAAARAQQSGAHATVPQQPLLALAEGDVPPLASALIGPYVASARLLGQRTAELHLALASDPDDPRFAPEPLTAPYQQALAQSMQGLTTEAFRLLRQRLADLPEAVRGEAQTGPCPGGGGDGSCAGGVPAADDAPCGSAPTAITTWGRCSIQGTTSSSRTSRGSRRVHSASASASIRR